MPGRPYVLVEATWKTIRDTRYEVAILPWGATEAHNYHLPYGTDTVESEHIAAESARIAWEAGVRVLVLPTVPFGVQSGQLDVPFCLHVQPSTQLALLADIVESVERHGVRKLVLLNGHGGNELRGLIREIQPEVDVFLCLVNTYSCLDAGPYFDEPGDHAGELETSLMQHLAPGLVLPLEEAGPGRARPFRIAGLREGWAWAPRQWTEVTEDTGVGDPKAATAEKGAAFFTALSERIAGFIVELAAADPDEMYG
jgi:creatinine amidohydrolase